MKALAIIALVLLIVLVVFARSRPPRSRAVAQLPEPSPAVHDLIARGDAIAAMRLYRQETQASLLEAEAVIRHYGGGQV